MGSPRRTHRYCRRNWRLAGCGSEELIEKSEGLGEFYNLHRPHLSHRRKAAGGIALLHLSCFQALLR
jgi:hypothetical protein